MWLSVSITRHSTDTHIHLTTATRVILQDITVPEDIGTVTVSVRRFGDLTLRSEGVLTPQPTSPEEASGEFMQKIFIHRLLYLVML